jgi:hypothetical protein
LIITSHLQSSYLKMIWINLFDIYLAISQVVVSYHAQAYNTDSSTQVFLCIQHSGKRCIIVAVFETHVENTCSMMNLSLL